MSQTTAPTSEVTRRDLQRRNEEMRLFVEAARRLGRTRDLDEIYDILHDVVVQIMPCTTLVVVHYDGEQQLRRRYVRHNGRRQDVDHLPPIQPDDAARERALVVPLTLDGEPIGVLQVIDEQQGAFSASDREFLEALACQFAAAAANAMLYRRAQQEIAERQLAEAAEREQRVFAEALADIASFLNRSLDLDEVLARILEQVGRVAPHQGANIMLIDEGVARVRRYAGYLDEFPISSHLIHYGFDVTGAETMRRMTLTRRAIVVDDAQQFEGWLRTADPLWIRSYVGAPIVLDDEVIGFLNLDAASPGFFKQADADRLQIFAGQVAVAVRNAQLYETLESAVRERTRELQCTVEQMNAIVNYSPQAVILCDLNGQIERGNPAVAQLFGYDGEQLLAHALDALVVEKDGPALGEALQAALHSQHSRRLQLTALRHDGAVFDADIALVPIVEYGAVRSLVCTVHDISGFKEVERLKDAFVSNVSHELRTPISSLKLYHGLLRRETPAKELYLQRMEREIDRLNVIIEDLLRLSRLEQGRTLLHKEASDLRHLVRQYVADRRPLVEHQGLCFTFYDAVHPLAVTADDGLIGQVFSILLTNAFTYTPLGGHVEVGFDRKLEDGQPYVGFFVRDDGPGIQPEEQSHLFKRFYRGHSGRQSGVAGTGLGLSIAEEIVRLHDGQIQLHSAGVAGHGATFWVWLPASEHEPCTVATTLHAEQAERAS